MREFAEEGDNVVICSQVQRKTSIMKKITGIALLLVLMGTAELYAQQEQENQKQIIGYYPNWRYYGRNGLSRPQKVDFSKYTIINYSFFKPTAEGTIISSDTWSDQKLLEESPTIIDLAHVAGTKVMVSIGGWTFSNHFPDIAADSAKTRRFAEECVRLLKQYRFDGIDIDWEFPGYEGHNGGPADKENFTKLMAAIREAIDAYGEEIDYPFLLTAAFGTYDDATNTIEWDTISQLLDYINMMTYDFNGPWSEDANHNSPLYPPKSGLEGSVDWVTKKMLDRYHVPKEKLNVGMAFYGRSFLFPDKNAELYAKNSKMADTITWPEYEGAPQYFMILDDMKQFNAYWDSTAQVPYLIKKDGTSVVSYDDEKSIRMKAEYIMDNDLAGVIIWEITGDFIESSPGSGKIGSTPLADQIVEAFGLTKRKRIKRGWK